MEKRVLSVILCFALLISMMANFSVNVYASYDNFNSKLNTIQNEYPNGSISSWQAPSGWYECWAYANQVSYEVFGSYGYTWDHHQDRSEIYPGDLIRYAGYYGTGHTIFVTGVDGDTIYYTDRNGTSTYNMVRWGASINRWNISFISGDKGRQGIYHAPNWDSVVGEPSVPQGSEMTSGYDRALPDGDYIIANAGSPDKSNFYYLDIPGVDYPATNETNVQIWGPLTSINSQDIWTLKYNDGFYSIKQKGTNMALDVYGSSKAQGANVQVYQSNTSSGQKWAIIHNDRNGYRVKAKCSGMSLDLYGANCVGGTNIQQFWDNDTDAQSWLFIPYNPAQPIDNGRYVISSALTNNKIISTDLTEENQNVFINSKGESIGNSVFEISKLDNGYYKIVHCNSGKALTVVGGASTVNANVALSVNNNTLSQQWAIIAYNGKYIVISRCNGYALDITGASTSDGTNIAMYRRLNNSNQLWLFEPAEVTVRFDANGGSSVSSIKTACGSNLSALPQTSRSGYIFLGWYTSRTGGAQLTKSTKITSNVTYYAHWYDLCENGEHSWGSWAVTTPATCTTTGVKTRICTQCGNNETDVIPATGHTPATVKENEKAATCCEDGYTGDTYCKDCNTKISSGSAISATGNHTDADGKWETDGTQHWHTCYYGTQFDVASHIGGTATCTEKAKCSVCGIEYGEYGEHTLTHHDRVEPDYENNGNIEYWTCDDCGKYFSDADGFNEITADDILIAKLVVSEYQFIDGEIIIEAPAGAIPEGALFDVQKIVPPPAEVVEKVKDQMGASSEVLAYYEIRLSDTSGELIIHLDGEITIKTKMPEQYTGSNCVRILQEDETGKLITMESWWEGEYLCYKTDWLEIYN